MTRTLLAATAALLLSTGLGSAAGLVPGSDYFDRQEQAAAERSVVAGTATVREAGGTSYGYPAAAEDRAPAARTPAETPTPAFAPTGKLVPGSDSF